MHQTARSRLGRDLMWHSWLGLFVLKKWVGRTVFSFSFRFVGMNVVVKTKMSYILERVFN